MGLERVIDEILSSGEEQRRKILAEATAEKERTLSAARREATEASERRTKEQGQKIALMRQQALSSAELEAKKRVLQEQKVLLSKAKAATLNALATLGPDERKRLLERLCRHAAKRLSGGVIHCRKEDESLLVAPAGFKMLGDLRASGGIVAESEDGTYRIDLTFEELLEDVWNRSVREVYSILFGGG